MKIETIIANVQINNNLSDTIVIKKGVNDAKPKKEL